MRVKLKTFLICFGLLFLLVLVRYVLSGKLYYVFILWNILLAAAPLWMESLMYAANRKWKGWVAKVATFALGGAWLLLLPNAFYILTDFMHQNSSVVVNMRNDGHYNSIHYARGDAIYMYDSLLIFIATVMGSYFGGMALLHAYVFFKKHISRLAAFAAVGSIMILSGIGVYIGRYGRWNSWDVLYRPLHILTDFISQFSSTSNLERIFVTVLTMVSLQAFALYGVNWIHKQRVSDGSDRIDS